MHSLQTEYIYIYMLIEAKNVQAIYKYIKCICLTSLFIHKCLNKVLYSIVFAVITRDISLVLLL